MYRDMFKNDYAFASNGIAFKTGIYNVATASLG